MKPIAVQLYTLREEAEKDLFKTLQRIADIGYDGVELGGLGKHDAYEVGDFISDLGMKVCCTHSAFPTNENIESIVETAKAIKTKRIVSGFWEDDFKTVEACKITAGKFRSAAQLLAPHDLSFAFHNHWMEFNNFNGQYAFDILMQEFSNLCSELDIYWASYAKADPVEILSKYKSNVPVLHVKDGMLAEPMMEMTAVGSGLLDIPKIINAADESVLEWLIVELDNYAGDMFEAVEKSYQYLASLSYVECCR